MSESKFEKKKILFVVTQTKWGGAQKYVLQLAKHFSRNNEVHIAYGEKKNKGARFFSECEKLKIKTIPVPFLVRKISPVDEFVAVQELAKIYAAGKYDLIHLNSSKAGVIGSLAAKVYGMNPYNLSLRIIYTAHGFVFNEPLSKVKRKFYKLAEGMAGGFHTAIIAVSEYDRQSAIKNNIGHPKKIFTIHNGIDEKNYTFLSREDARKELELNNDYKYFGTIASFYETKGHKYYIDAIKILADEKSDLLEKYRWVFIGDGPELESIKLLARENDVSKYISFKKPQNNDWQHLKAFDVFVLPSVKEGLPYTILEAGLAYVPVICTKVGGVPEIIKDNETGIIVPPANPLSLAEAMKQADKNRPQLEQMAKNNYHNIKKSFSLEETLSETEKLYLKLFS